MRRTSFAVFTLASVLAGCCDTIADMGGQDGGNFSRIEKGVDGMDQVELSEEEARLLVMKYPAEEQEILRGELFPHQLEALGQLRAAEEYLKQKYPKYRMEYLSFYPADKFNPKGILTFRSDSYAESKVEVSVEPEEYVCRDTFYSVLIGPGYDEWLSGIISTGGVTVQVQTVFTEPMGLDFYEQKWTARILEEYPKFQRISNIYIEGYEDKDKAVESVKDIILENHVYGSYFVWIVPENFWGETTDNLEKIKREMESVTFNCFDIGGEQSE